MTMQVVFEHELRIKNELNGRSITQEQLWNALTFVLLNRPQFSDLFTGIKVGEEISDELKTTRKVSVKMQNDQWISEEIDFYPEKKILLKVQGGAHHPDSSVEIDFETTEEGDFALRFTYGENPEMKKSLGLEMPEELEQIRHQAWKMKDAELVAGALEMLVREKH